jgi:hypothetical protein
MSYSHAHYFGVRTSIHLGHSHFLDFFSFPANGTSTDGHSHDYTGITKYSEKPIRHFHRYQGVTGAAIPLPDGSHYHEVLDEVNNEPFQLQPFGGGMYKTILEIKRHTHSFSGLTGTEIGRPPHNWMN